MQEVAEKKASNIVLALDLAPNAPNKLLHKAKEILEAVHLHVCAVKFNRHLILPLGLFSDGKKLLKQVKDYGLPSIMDCKINDIGNTNRIISEHYYQAGFEALIANPFVGWVEGLKPVFETAKKMDRGVILLVYMSHKAAWEGYGQRVFFEGAEEPVFQYEVFARKALQWDADGAVVGATYPRKIEEVHAITGRKVPIYSPGIGAQGGKIEDAISRGAEYLIVGRAITEASDPSRIAEKMKLTAQTTLRKTKQRKLEHQ